MQLTNNDVIAPSMKRYNSFQSFLDSNKMTLKFVKNDADSQFESLMMMSTEEKKKQDGFDEIMTLREKICEKMQEDRRNDVFDKRTKDNFTTYIDGMRTDFHGDDASLHFASIILKSKIIRVNPYDLSDTMEFPVVLPEQEEEQKQKNNFSDKIYIAAYQYGNITRYYPIVQKD